MRSTKMIMAGNNLLSYIALVNYSQEKTKKEAFTTWQYNMN